MTILYIGQQIDDIKEMCCTGQTVLGVDKTFNLCRMHVTDLLQTDDSYEGQN